MYSVSSLFSDMMASAGEEGLPCAEAEKWWLAETATECTSGLEPDKPND